MIIQNKRIQLLVRSCTLVTAFESFRANPSEPQAPCKILFFQKIHDIHNTVQNYDVLQNFTPLISRNPQIYHVWRQSPSPEKILDRFHFGPCFHAMFHRWKGVPKSAPARAECTTRSFKKRCFQKATSCFHFRPFCPFVFHFSPSKFNNILTPYWPSFATQQQVPGFQVCNVIEQMFQGFAGLQGSMVADFQGCKVAGFEGSKVPQF